MKNLFDNHLNAEKVSLLVKMKGLIGTPVFYYPTGVGYGTLRQVVTIIDVIQDDRYGHIFCKIKLQHNQVMNVLTSTLTTGSKEELMLSLLENA